MIGSVYKYLSIIIAVLFGVWIVWLWVEPEKKQHQVKLQKPVIQKQQETHQVIKNPQPASQITFVLPAPPAPKPASVPETISPKPESVKQKETPQPKEIKVAEKVQASPKPVEKKKAAPTSKPQQRVKVQPKSQIKSKPKPVAKPEPQPVIHKVTQVEAVTGRALLRVLEHGKGPQIEIAWPKSSQAREKLHRVFQECFGMKNALMDTSGDLYRAEEARGVRWEINLDRYSGFLRQASGRLPNSEQRVMRAIDRYHRGLNDPVPVRIFPRRVDASLLGGLKAVVGEGYMNATSIQARYIMTGSHVRIEDIRLDGRMLDGVIELSRYIRCNARA